VLILLFAGIAGVCIIFTKKPMDKIY